MTQDERNRLGELQSAWCSPQMIMELHGIPIREPEDRFIGKCRAWARSHRGQQLERQEDDYVNRYVLEQFMQYEKLVSVKRAALSLGMEEDSLRRILASMEEDFLIPNQYEYSNWVISSRFVQEIYRYFDDTRGVVFGSHNVYCKRLHIAIYKVLNIEVLSLYDTTSVLHEEHDPDYSTTLDHVSLEPVGVRYKVWLDTKKPINLAPDVCSYKIYFNNLELLEPLVVGTKPTAPNWFNQ